MTLPSLMQSVSTVVRAVEGLCDVDSFIVMCTSVVFNPGYTVNQMRIV